MSRGPAYPYIDLKEAVDLVRKLYAYAGKKPAAYDAVAKEAWNVSPTSSSTVKILAALKYFGLVDSGGNDRNGLVKITDRGARILMDHGDAAVHTKDLQDAALSPRWYKFCWDHWGREMPPAMKSTLLLEHGFIPTTVESFLRGYKKTIEYAGLLVEHSVHVDGDDQDDSVESGDKNGENGTTAGKDAGANSDNLASTLTNRGKSPQLPPLQASMRQDTFTLEEGNVVIQWPAGMSKDSLQDFEDWLEILKRKVRRAAAPQETAAAPADVSFM